MEKHNTYERGAGQPLTFLRMTGLACDVCFPKGELGVIQEDSTSTTLHCNRCDNTFSKPQGSLPNQPRLPPMNSRLRRG
jgi:hypothetical protein